MKKVIATPDAPKAVGPYSQAIEVNGTLYISGRNSTVSIKSLESRLLMDTPYLNRVGGKRK